jgi:prolyl oligopeptidase
MKTTAPLLFVCLSFALACANSQSGTAPPRSSTRAGPGSTAGSESSQRAEGPPRAPVRPVTDDYFGRRVVDPYRWMETPGSPELAAWMRAQDEYTRAHLGRIAVRDELRRRLQELDRSIDRVAIVAVEGKWVFYFKRPAGSELAKLYVREGIQGAERLLFDPQTETSGGAHVSLNEAVPSPDGRYVAISTSAAGSEDGIVRVLETATGAFTSDRIDRVNFAAWGHVVWLDGKRFAVGRLQKLAPGAAQTDRYKNIREYLHTLGSDPEADPVMAGRGVNPAIDVHGVSDWVDISFIPTIPYVFAMSGHGTDEDIALYAAPLARIGRGQGDRIPWKKMAGFDDQVNGFAAHGDDLYLLSHKGAPRYKVLRTRLSRPDTAHADVVVPPGRRVLRSIVAARDGLYVTATESVLGRLMRVPWRGRDVEDVAVPLEGALSLDFADLRRDGVLFEQESWLVPRAIFSYEPKPGRAVDTGLQPPGSVDMSRFSSTLVEAESADHTRVPLSIIMRRDAPRDGKSFALLDAYGGYGVSNDPYFDPRRVAFYERGLLAVCHVRGGGELGKDWHEQGRLGNKHHTWEDFIACAEYLIAHRYTSPAKLVGRGTSMGGVCIGNAAVRRPDLFAAALMRVGVLNPLRMEATFNIFQVPEIGSVETPAGFEMLLAMDAYHQVKDGGRYPAVLLTTGAYDPRVAPWQVTKMAARLQAATASGRPVLLRVEAQGGHGIGSTATQTIDETADTLAFALEQTGSR